MWARILAVAALLCATIAVPMALGANTGVARAANAKSSTADGKHCYEVVKVHGKTEQVPIKCPKVTHKKTCYLTGRRHGKAYKRKVTCPVKVPTKGATGATGSSSAGSGSATKGSGGGSGGSGSSGTAGSGSGAKAPATVDWAAAVPAVCEDSSTAATDGEGDFWCADQSSPYCTDQTAALVSDPGGDVVCVPYTSIPAAGVCDDASNPGSGGADQDGTALCADGNYPILASDAQSGGYSNDNPGVSCDDGSNPGDGGYDASGTALCADGTYPS
jgi:hypothetical protein